jgi:phosphoribosylanthranilate isomerase
VTEVKFCGMTRTDDVREAVKLGASYVGAIMTESPRRVTPETARALFAAIDREGVKRVGVFGEEPIESIIDAARIAGVDVVQLHGQDAGWARLKSTLGVDVWRVLRVGGKQLTPAQRVAVRGSDGVLFDTLSRGVLGGSGVAFQWDLVANDVRELRTTTRIILAGGLRPENVRGAIDLLVPDVVDVSSGVESSPGIKDHSRMAAFMNAVRHTPAPSAS